MGRSVGPLSSQGDSTMNQPQRDRQVLDFLKRTGEEIKTETQKILEEIRDPENQQRIRDSLTEFGSWAKQTAEEATVLMESALQKAKDRMWGKTRARNSRGQGMRQGTKRAKRSSSRGRVSSRSEE